MIFRIVLRSKATFPIIITIILLVSILTPYRAVMSHFQTVKELVSEYAQKSKYYFSHNNGTVKVEVYSGYINGYPVIILKTDNISALLDSLGISMSSMHDLVIGLDILNFLGNDTLTIKINNQIIKVTISGSTMSIGGVYKNYIILSNNIGVNIEPKYVYYVNPLSGPYPVSNAETFVEDLSNSFIELIRVWSIPIYMLILVCTLINSMRLIRALDNDIKKLIVIGAKRKTIFLQFIMILSIIVFTSVFIGISLGYVLSQVLAKIFYWVFDILIIPIINIKIYAEVLIYGFISSLIGVITPLYLYLSRGDYIDQI